MAGGVGLGVVGQVPRAADERQVMTVRLKTNWLTAPLDCFPRGRDGDERGRARGEVMQEDVVVGSEKGTPGESLSAAGVESTGLLVRSVAVLVKAIELPSGLKTG